MTKSRKNNFLGFNPLNVGLFVALVFAIVFIGSYQYTNSVTDSDELEGELGTYIDPRPYDPDSGMYAPAECRSDSDCPSPQHLLTFCSGNDGNDIYTRKAYYKCNPDTLNANGI